jgi:hypothetical protein
LFAQQPGDGLLASPAAGPAWADIFVDHSDGSLGRAEIPMFSRFAPEFLDSHFIAIL